VRFTKRKFASFPLKKQHKKAAELLKLLYEQQTESSLFHYRELERYLSLPPVPFNKEALADRYHFHLKHASVSVSEHNFLPNVKRFDALSDTPYLPIAIYLDNLRSGHNVGSIIRTTEAFRLGTLYFSKQTPFVDNKKVQDAAMGTVATAFCKVVDNIYQLPKPRIALETVEGAKSIFDFTFPERCTIMIGNEEYGLSSHALAIADHIIQIPLVGTKNSLNVACAFSILAAAIRL
jgi:tRNA G18 (ribose-2'-O)-methylase SpoU